MSQTQTQHLWWIGTLHFQDSHQELSNDEYTDICQGLQTTIEAFAPFAKFQVEEGEATQRRHVQIVLKLKERKRINQVRELSCFPRRFFKPGHWESVKDIPKAIEYCGKMETRIVGPFLVGEEPTVTRGKRTDLDEVAAAVRDGAQDLEIIQDHPGTFARYFRGLYAIRNALVPPMVVQRSVHLLYGPPGTGKSYAVRFHPDFGVEGDPSRLFVLPTGGNVWFDGLAGQPVALLDDFGGKTSKVTLTDLLQWLDSYPVRVPIKGGFAYFLAETVCITTNIHPADWYEYVGREEHYLALQRRFTSVWHFRARDNFAYLRRGQPAWDDFWARVVDPFPRPGRLPHVEVPNAVIDLSQDD